MRYCRHYVVCCGIELCVGAPCTNEMGRHFVLLLWMVGHPAVDQSPACRSQNPGETKVITRTFRVRVPVELHMEFEEKFLSVSLPHVRSAPGLASVFVGRPTRWTPDEYVMISLWESEEDLAAFAGEEWNRAVIPAGMERFVSECWIHHYENFG
jgi:heme oxygenase (mycobilin-producing)